MAVANEDADCQMTSAVMTPCFILESFFNHYSPHSQLCTRWFMSALGPWLSFHCYGLYGCRVAICFRNLSLFGSVLVWPDVFQRNCTRLLGGWRSTTADTSRVRERGAAFSKCWFRKAVWAAHPSWQTCLPISTLFLVCSFFFIFLPVLCIFPYPKSRKPVSWEEQKPQRLLFKL